MAEDVQQEELGEEEGQDYGGEPEAPQTGRQQPRSYLLRGDGLFRHKPATRRTAEDWILVSHCNVWVHSRAIDVADGSVHLRLGWERNGARKFLDVPRADAMNTKGLVELAGRDFPVSSATALELTRYLAAYESTNLAVLPQRRVAFQTGWQGKDGEFGFLWGTVHIPADGKKLDINSPDRITFNPSSGGGEQFISGFKRQGTFDGWQSAVKAVSGYPRVMASVYASLSSTLLTVLNAPNYVKDVSTGTSEGKTVDMRGAASVWGNPNEMEADSIINSWDTTAVGIEQKLGLVNGLPVFLDDTSRVTTNRKETVPDIIYLIANGRGRNRGGLKGLAGSYHFRTVGLSTGEAPLRDFLGKGGAVMRTLQVEGSPFGSKTAETAEVVKAYDRAVRENYGHAGPRLVIWLCKHRDQWEALRLYHKEREEHYRAKGGEAARLADHAATLDVTARVAREALGLDWLPQEPAEVLWAGFVEAAKDADNALEALEGLYSWAATNPHRFYSAVIEELKGAWMPKNGWAGRMEPFSYIAFVPQRAKEFLERAGYNPALILKRWQQQEWLVKSTETEARWKVMTDVDGHKVRCLKVSYQTLQKVGIVGNLQEEVDAWNKKMVADIENQKRLAAMGG